MHNSGCADIHFIHSFVFEYHLWFSAVFQVFLILYQKSHLAHHATDAEHTYALHVSTSHSPSYTHTHTNSHTPMQSSRQACCLICYFEPERHCDIKQLVYGERKKGGKSVRERKKRSERAAEGEQGSFIIKRMQLLKE